MPTLEPSRESAARHPPARTRLLGRNLVCWFGLSLASIVSAQPVVTEATGQGALLYHNYCSVCHGDRGDGRSRASGALSTVPRDFTSAASKAELTRERIVLAITHGRPGTAMVGWTTQLSASDIETLADHVLARFVHRGPSSATPPPAVSGTHAHGGRQADAAGWDGPAAARSAGETTAMLDATRPVDMALRLPDGRQGSLKRGAAFYAANCATCHGAGGDGAGPRAYFINPKPRNFTDAASRARLNRPALARSIAQGRVGTEMPAWDKVTTPQQIADVAEYVFQAFVSPAPTAPPPHR